MKEIRNFRISVSSDEGRSNPQIHTPAMKRVVRFGPEVSEIFIKNYEYRIVYLVYLFRNIELHVSYLKNSYINTTQ